MQFTGRIQHNVDKLRQMRQAMMVENIMGGAFPDVQFNKLGDAVDRSNEKLLRFNHVGRMTTLLFGSEMPTGASRLISSMGLVMNTMDVMTSRARVMQFALRGAMLVGAGAVGYGVGRMAGDRIAGMIYNPENTEVDQGNRAAVAQANRQNAMTQSDWDARNRLLQIELRTVDPLSKEAEYLQEQLITRTHLVDRAKAAAEAGVIGVENADRIYQIELATMRAMMARGRAQRESAEYMDRINAKWREEKEFAESVNALLERGRQIRAAINAQRRETGLAASEALGGRGSEALRLQGFMASLKNMSPEQAAEAADAFAVQELSRKLRGEQSELSRLQGLRPQAVRGGFTGLEDYIKGIQSAVSTVRPGEEQWQQRVAATLERMAGLEDQIAKILDEKLGSGVELSEGEF
jgi:hypothetical protein